MENKKLDELRRSVQLHLNWFIRAIAGDEALSASELEELSKFKALPKKGFDFVRDAFFLGRLKATLKKSEFKSLDLQGLKKAMKKAKLTELEKLAVLEAQNSAGAHLRSFANEIEDGIFSKISATQSAIVSEATVKDLIKDEVSFALFQKKSWQELASSLEKTLNTSQRKKVERIARTELHAAEQRGVVQAISNKIDIYSHSDGPNSKVSVVTEPGRCNDCAKLYEEEDGSPKIFKLSQLLLNGTNADRKHTRSQGLHNHWRPVVPPAHPSCYCELRYVPPGYAWQGKRLVLVDREALKKAIGDSALSATQKPKGPPQGVQTPKPGNAPGVAAPGQGGASTGSSQPQGAAGIEYDYYSNPGAPPAEGNWESYTRQDGSSGYRRPKGTGGRSASPEDEQQQKIAQIQESINWGKGEHSVDEHIKNLEEAGIIDKRELGEDEKGITDSYLVSLGGGQRALMKPPAFTTGKHEEEAKNGFLTTDGARSVPYGTGHKREAASFKYHQLMGLENFVPPTSTRNHEGSPMSMQSWQEGFEPIMSSFSDADSELRKKFVQKVGAGVKPTNVVKHLVEMVPEDKKEAFIEKLSMGAVAGIATNHADQHLNNVIMNDDWDLRFIDNSLSFGSSMDGQKSQIHRDMHNLGMKLKVPDTLMKRWENTSLGDLKRALGKDLEPWAVGQQFLRQKYLTHLQNTEGHLDYEKFRTVMAPGAEMLSHINFPRKGTWAGTEKEQQAEFESRRESGLLSHQLFDSFAKQWMNDAAAGPDGPDKAAAEELLELGVFMGPGHSVDPDHRRDKKHIAYEKTITPGYPPKTLLSPNAKTIGEAKTELASPADSMGTGAQGPRARRRAARQQVKKSIYIDLDRHRK